LVESSHEFLEQGTGSAKALLPTAQDIDALVRAEHRDPFAILGPHGDGAGGQFIRAYLPGALKVEVLDKDVVKNVAN
jgi:1,4-alpha-glucan branching enzyme